MCVCPGQKAASPLNPVPVNDLKALVTLARDQYLRMIDSKLPSAARLTDQQEGTISEVPGTDRVVPWDRFKSVDMTPLTHEDPFQYVMPQLLPHPFMRSHVDLKGEKTECRNPIKSILLNITRSE